MTGVDAPQSCGSVQDGAIVAGEVEHALGARHQARIGLEAPVGREWHPECLETGANIGSVGHGAVSAGRQKRGRISARFQLVITVFISSPQIPVNRRAALEIRPP
jgi:hypothetical protein